MKQRGKLILGTNHLCLTSFRYVSLMFGTYKIAKVEIENHLDSASGVIKEALEAKLAELKNEVKSGKL